MTNTTANMILVTNKTSLDRFREATDIELHVNGNTALTKRFGKKIKAAGGTYSECRGHSYKRFVTLPIEGNEALINALATEFYLADYARLKAKDANGFNKTRDKGMVVVFRYGSKLPAWADVVNVPKTEDMLGAALNLYRANVQSAVERGILHEVTQEQIDARQVEIAAEHRAMDIERAKATADKLESLLKGLGINATAHLDAINTMLLGAE